MLPLLAFPVRVGQLSALGYAEAQMRSFLMQEGEYTVNEVEVEETLGVTEEVIRAN